MIHTQEDLARLCQCPPGCKTENIDPKRLQKHPANIPMYGDKKVEAFIADIAKNGVQEPIVILPDLTVISGHRRRQAAIISDIPFVPCLMRPDIALQGDVAVEAALIRFNAQRIKSEEITICEVVRLLELTEMSVSDIAEVTGSSPRTVRRVKDVESAVAAAEGVGDVEEAAAIREEADGSLKQAAESVRKKSQRKKAAAKKASTSSGKDSYFDKEQQKVFKAAFGSIVRRVDEWHDRATDDSSRRTRSLKMHKLLGEFIELWEKANPGVDWT